ncbi:N-terminal ig-like domain of cellulase [Sphingomonas gellani]|uniref:N-terminal ig-like domain of cellulase n=1 Tax=Sphingomonas gellani TaxID=1166340 RepID=A0A1H8DAR9_9SPHN|nr:glycoside hydrolase family 9 protein [Sphingomonas gellani]SEN04461.1 N-terminal ig-like domain of cellulase [Sphingomonas gellani]
MLKAFRALSASVAVCALTIGIAGAQTLTVSPAQTLETRGLSVLVDQNQFSPIFFDEKNAGIQIVLHGDRIATDGAVRLDKTPEQWAPVPAFVDRTVDKASGSVIVRSAYKDQNLSYRVRVTPEGEGGFRIAVDLDQPLPAALVGKAGFNLDFLPSSYFGKTYLMDNGPGLFPRHPTGPMATDGSGDPLPLASGGRSLTLAPEDPLTQIAITSDTGTLSLYDARARAQNGWFVVRSEIAAGAKDNAVVWHVRPNVVKDWVRPPVVSFNQAGYTPGRAKVALIELDPNFAAPREAELVKLGTDGEHVVLRAPTTPRGRYTRYDYAAFDFSGVRDPGIYAIRYAGHTSNPFRIAPDAYDRIWQTSLDTFIAEQMDHVGIREQYRVWSAPSHLDDARQAPANHVHFDGYRMGPNLDSPFKAGEHIPGLAVGGFQDAGDYDIQTPENAQVVRDLVWARELYGLDWDQTSVDEAARAVEIRKPDGQEDAIQQIRHGTLQLLAQYKVFGHAIVGIVDPALRQYAHLGDAGSQTDGRLYDPALKPDEVRGDSSGKADDRWAFTTDLPANNLAVAGALAGAARALRASDPAMATEALDAAKVLWTRQQGRPVKSGDGRDDSSSPRSAEVANVVATVELLLTTNDKTYATRLRASLPVIEKNFAWTAAASVRALPAMDAAYRTRIARAVRTFKAKVDGDLIKNPFGVPITEGTWAGSNQVVAFGSTMHLLHTAFPDIVGTSYTLDAIDYVLGRHPANNLSLVSTVGTQSKLIGYGHNRADYSFIPGGLVPGVLIVKPDLPEAKTDWPFLWFENEYTVSTTSAYILAARAAQSAAKGIDQGASTPAVAAPR